MDEIRRAEPVAYAGAFACLAAGLAADSSLILSAVFAAFAMACLGIVWILNR